MIKMSALMNATGETRSTILFYVKEGLLPEPQKPKPNLHLYDESCIQIIQLIKLFQTRFGYTIDAIKQILATNRFDFTDGFDVVVKSIDTFAADTTQRLDADELAHRSETTREQIDQWCEKRYITPSQGAFTVQDVKIATLLKRCEEVRLDHALFDTYVQTAEALATMELDTGRTLLEQSENNAQNEAQTLLFDIILQLKPYLFNKATVREHSKRLAAAQ